MAPLLEIKDLHASVGDTPILKGINLTINVGEVHAIMGPNGSGKSTMSYALAGREGYEVTGGDILMNGKSLLEMEADERARAGMFLAFQYPVELPGVGGMRFWRAAFMARRFEEV
jgi:Fe-S cluster assembly ATP-binding protein